MSRRSPLVSCSLLLIQYICSYRPHLQDFSPLQSKDAACHVEKGIQYNTIQYNFSNVISAVLFQCYEGHHCRISGHTCAQ
jgi:hypothetical protein